MPQQAAASRSDACMVDQGMSGFYTLLSSTMSQQSEPVDESSVSGTITTIYTDSEVDSSGSTTTHIGGDQHFGSPNPGDNTPNGSGRVHQTIHCYSLQGYKVGQKA